jgi:hypothetical protein
MRTLVAAALLVLASPALAQGYSRPEIIRGLCQKDGCDEFSVLGAERMRGDEEGTLFRTRLRTYHASSRGRAEKGDETGYVFCSATKPTILAEGNGKVAGFQIATAPTQESRESKRQQANFYAMYFTICHGADAGRAAVQNMEAVAQQYGYRSPLAKSVTVTFASPDEVFSRPAQGSTGQLERSVTPERLHREARSDDVLLPPRNIPHAQESWIESRREERVIEGRPAAQEEPWYREPQRWIESMNPF